MAVKFDAQKFRSERKKKTTQAKLAEKADTSIRYIHDLEHGTKSNPSASMVYRLSSALTVPMEALMKEETEPEEQ